MEGDEHGMIRDITVGQYYPSGTIIHRLDPRVKLFGTIIYIICLFFKQNIWIYLFETFVLFGLIKLSKVPIKFMLRGMKSLVLLLAFSGFVNIFFIKGSNVLWQWKRIAIYEEGIKAALYLGGRLILLVIGSSLLTNTTTPTQITDGIEKSLRLLNTLKVPVHEFAIILTISLRFIPTLADEMDKILKAQTARCVDFESRNPLKKVQKMVPVLIPLFVSVIRRSDELALAMDARCYRGGSGRTKMYPLSYNRKDYIAYSIVMGYFLIMIILVISIK